MCSERKFTLGRFDRGGRFFGGFWINLPKVVRLQGLRIDDEEVAGLEYPALNPRLAYYLAEANPPPGDAYTLPGLEQSRDGVKRASTPCSSSILSRSFLKAQGSCFRAR